MPSMRKERTREKLINAIIYFSENVNNAGKVKIFKMLYFLDFMSFEETGKSVTGLQYFAWDMGPVPEELFYELKSPTKELTNHLLKRNKKYPSGVTQEVYEARHKFESQWFSDYELALMGKLAKTHFNDFAKDMTDKSHFETGPWDEVYNVQGRRSEHIPYELCLMRRANEKDMQLLEIAKEYDELRQNYG